MIKEDFVKTLVRRLNSFSPFYNYNLNYGTPLETKYYYSKVFRIGELKKIVIPYFIDINKEKLFTGNSSLLLKVNLFNSHYYDTYSTYSTLVKKLLSCCFLNQQKQFKYDKNNEVFIVNNNGIYYRETNGEFKLLLILGKCINNNTDIKNNYLIINRDIYTINTKLNKEIRSYIPYFIKYKFQLVVLTNDSTSLIQELIIDNPLTTNTLKGDNLKYTLDNNIDKLIL